MNNNQEDEEDRILHFVVVERPRDVFSLVNDYVEHIYELKDRRNIKDHLEEVLYHLIEEVQEIVYEEVMLDTLLRCGESLSKKEHYD